MKKLFTLLALVFVTAGCVTTGGGGYSSKPRFHVISGSDNRGWNASDVTIYDTRYIAGGSARVVRHNSSGRAHVEFDGDITEANMVTAKELFDYAKSFNGNVTTRVFLNSGGGNLWQGVQFGRHLRNNGAKTIVAKGQNCVSACSQIFIGGYYRDIQQDGYVGVHAPYLPDDIDTVGCVSRYAHDMRWFEEYVEDMFKNSSYYIDRYMRDTFSVCSRSRAKWYGNNSTWLEN